MNLKLTRGKKALVISKILFLISLLFFLKNEPALSNVIELKYVSYGPPLYYKKEAEQLFLDEIMRQTGGRIRIQTYYNNSLLKSNEILEGISSGKAELGLVNIAYYPKRLILNSAVYLFQRGPTRYENIMWVYDRIYRELPVLNNEINQFNQKVIYTYAKLPTAVFFNKPVTRFSDFKGKRIRCASRWAREILKGMGAVPISTSLEDLYDAIKANAIEGVLTTYGATYMSKFEQLTQYIFIARELWTPIPFHITVNLDAWNQFPRDIQEGIEKAAQIAREKFSKNYLEWFEWFISEHNKMGRTIVFADKKDITTWTQMPETKLILNQWKAEAKNAGYPGATFLLEKIRKIIHEGIERDNM